MEAVWRTAVFIFWGFLVSTGKYRLGGLNKGGAFFIDIELATPRSKNLKS